MSEIYREFERQLDGWQTRFAGRPHRELVALYLLALEREINVVVAYDPATIVARLARLPLTGEGREIIRAALARVWQDEEMHAVYTRDALLKLGGMLLGLRTQLHEVAGMIGGWTVSVRQHQRWSDAPLARAVATLFTWAGRASGRVPTQVGRHLTYSSFRQFCRYNAHTEGTAWLCWHRLAQLGTRLSVVSAQQVDAFEGIAADEERHRQIFHMLAEALCDDGRLAPGMTTAGLVKHIGAVGNGFLPA